MFLTEKKCNYNHISRDDIESNMITPIKSAYPIYADFFERKRDGQ